MVLATSSSAVCAPAGAARHARPSTREAVLRIPFNSLLFPDIRSAAHSSSGMENRRRGPPRPAGVATIGHGMPVLLMVPGDSPELTQQIRAATDGQVVAGHHVEGVIDDPLLVGPMVPGKDAAVAGVPALHSYSESRWLAALALLATVLSLGAAFLSAQRQDWTYDEGDHLAYSRRLLGTGETERRSYLQF